MVTNAFQARVRERSPVPVIELSGEINSGAEDALNLAFSRARPQFSIVGGRTFFADMSLNYTSCHGRPTPWSLSSKPSNRMAASAASGLDPVGVDS